MSLETTTSRIVYQGNGGTKVFSFPFKVWKPSQVKVFLSSSEGDENDVSSQVSVALTATGGTVTFAKAPAKGETLAILRSMPFVQEDVYITGTRFDPHEIEEALDVAAAERQELKERADRHLAVPATSTRTPQEVMHSILSIADQANAYLTQVIEIKEDVVELKDNAQALITQTGDEQAGRVEDVGDTEVQEVRDEGQVQLDRLAGYADVAAIAEGFAAALQVWRLDKDVTAGESVRLPNELQYIPGHHHLWLSVGGIVLSPSFYEEVGKDTEPSRDVVFRMNLKAGQEIMAWVIPLGKAYEIELTSRIAALEEALSDLSRRVVYADAED